MTTTGNNAQIVEYQSIYPRLIDISSLQLIELLAEKLPELLKLKSQNEGDEFIGDEEVTRMLKIKKATLNSLTSKRILTYYQPNKSNLFLRSDIVEYIKAHKKPSQNLINQAAEEFILEKDDSKRKRISRRDLSFEKK